MFSKNFFRKLVMLAMVAASLVTMASLALGQAPVITTAGDPSVQADSIYKLAVDPTRYPTENLIFLLDDAVLRLDATGRGTRTYRQIVQILKQPVVASTSERQYSYSPDHEKFTLNWVKVVGQNGEVLSSAPAQMQESDVPASTSNPIYVNQKVVRISLARVAVGTIIDISYTVEETKPFHEGDSYFHWNVTSSSAHSVRSRFVYEVPASVQPRLTERNLDFKVVTTEQGGRRTYTWARKDVPKYRAEPFAPDTNSVQMYVIASLPTTWPAIAAWYDSLAGNRYTLTPAIETKIRELVTGARTRTDTIRAVHKWVAQDIRYVSVSLGLGGYQPRTPEQTFTTGFGDCKDKATIFIAAMRKLGIEAHPVLLHQSGTLVRKDHPSIRQFNHVIAAIPEGNGFTFADLTASYTPLGDVPVPSQGGFVVIVQPNGRTREVNLPKMAPGSRKITYNIVGTLDTAGMMSGSMEEINSGQGFEARRSVFGVPLDSARRATVMRGLIAIIPGARPDSMQAFDGKDLYAPVRYKVYFSNGRGVANTGGAGIFTFPFGVMNGNSRITTIEGFGARKTSINAEEVLRAPPPSEMEVDMRITLPEGWRVRVPTSVVAKGDFGTYSTEYSQEGRAFRIVRREISAFGVYPPSRLPDVIAFFKATAADENNRSIIIEKGGGG